MGMLDGELRAIALSWERFAPRRAGVYRMLTDIGPRLAACASSHGRWVRDRTGYWTVSHPYRVRNETWDSLVFDFARVVFEFGFSHPEFLLERKGAGTTNSQKRPGPVQIDAESALANIALPV
jgi:hypothetical protein